MRKALWILAVYLLYVSSIMSLTAQENLHAKAVSGDHSVTSSGTEAKPPRFAQLTMEQLNEQQKALAQDFLKVSSGGLGGPYNLYLRSPEMSQKRFALMGYLRFHTSVPRSLNEFAILIQARLATAQYEWWAHYPLALKAGLPQTVADDLKDGKLPTKMSPEEAAVYQLCLELSLDHKVSDAAFNALRKYFSEQQISWISSSPENTLARQCC